jgi:hypothetical protein
LWPLTTLAWVIERTKSCYPSHYDGQGDLKPVWERMPLVKAWLSAGMGHTWGAMLDRFGFHSMVHCPALHTTGAPNPSLEKKRKIAEEKEQKEKEKEQKEKEQKEKEQKDEGVAEVGLESDAKAGAAEEAAEGGPPAAPGSAPDRSGRYAVEGYYAFPPAMFSMLTHWCAEVGGPGGEKEKASMRTLLERLLNKCCGPDGLCDLDIHFPDWSVQGSTVHTLHVSAFGKKVDLARLENFMQQKGGPEEKPRVESARRKSVLCTGSAADADFPGWLIALKSRPKAAPVYAAVVTALSRRLEAEWEPPGVAEEQEVRESATAVFGRRWDPEVRKHCMAATHRGAAVTRNAARSFSAHSRGGLTSNRARRSRSSTSSYYHAKVQGASYYIGLKQEFQDIDFPELTLDDSRFPSTLGGFRDHMVSFGMNKLTGVTGGPPPLVRGLGSSRSWTHAFPTPRDSGCF